MAEELATQHCAIDLLTRFFLSNMSAGNACPIQPLYCNSSRTLAPAAAAQCQAGAWVQRAVGMVRLFQYFPGIMPTWTDGSPGEGIRGAAATTAE